MANELQFIPRYAGCLRHGGGCGCLRRDDRHHCRLGGDRRRSRHGHRSSTSGSPAPAGCRSSSSASSVTVAITGVSAVLSVTRSGRPIGAIRLRRVVGHDHRSDRALPSVTSCYGTFGDDDINVNPGEEVIVHLSTKSTAGSGYVTAGFSCFTGRPDLRRLRRRLRRRPPSPTARSRSARSSS